MSMQRDHVPVCLCLNPRGHFALSSSAPFFSVYFRPSPDAGQVVPSRVNVTPAMWNVTQTVAVQSFQDVVAVDTPFSFTVTFDTQVGAPALPPFGGSWARRGLVGPVSSLLFS